MDNDLELPLPRHVRRRNALAAVKFASGVAVLLLVVSFLSSCATLTPPTSLTGPGKTAFYANEVTIAFGTLQHAAIELNKVALLSEANTRVVVDATTDVVTTLKATPEGWKPTAITGLDRVKTRLDAAGKSQLDPYITGVQTILQVLR